MIRTKITRRHTLAMGLAGTALACPPAQAVATNDTVRQTLHRLIGARASQFDFTAMPPQTMPTFSVRVRDGRVRIHADTPVGMARGAYAYLKSIGAALTSWEGDRVALPEHFTDADIAPTPADFRHRAYFNPCTYGYTMAFWGWKRWQREIDWMALHGIDMPLALEGQEYVYRKLWAAQGLNDGQLDAYFTGPAFLPWHRMGNIEGYDTPLPAAWIEKKHALQKRILARMRAFAMTPILPAFAGYVPKAFAQKHPNANIHRMEPWGGFHETYWLDPLDPLFAPLAKEFLDIYTQTYGTGTHYLADSFNEMRPPIAKDAPAEVRENRLAAYGKALHRSIADVTPTATFVMQGWLFGIDAEFWTPQTVAAFLRDIPDDGMLILDIVNDSYPGSWKRNHAFFGKKWIFGYIHNFGGNNPLFGDFGLYEKDLNDLLRAPDRGNLQGFGVFPEGLNTNSSVYEYMFDRAWSPTLARTVDDWFEEYLRARYGRTDAPLLQAWSHLRTNVYRTYNWRGGWWNGAFGTYLLCKRPAMKFAAYDGDPKDIAPIVQAARDLAAQSARYGDCPLYRYDAIAATVHAASLEIDRTLIVMIQSLRDNRLTDAERAWNRVRILLPAVDDVMGSQPFTLAAWVEDAALYAASSAEAAYYIREAKTQVTVWGGDAVLNDYASKAWQGLYRDFYLPRWEAFYSAARAASMHGERFDEKRFTDAITAWEWNWTRDPAIPMCRKPHAPTRAMQDILAQL